MDILKQGTRVKFKIADLNGEGTIVGVSTNPQPVIGSSYIIDPDVSIRNEVYDYSHFVAFGCQLEVIK